MTDVKVVDKVAPALENLGSVATTKGVVKSVDNFFVKSDLR